MYNVIFLSDNGEQYTFGQNGKTVFDMDFGKGIPTNIGASQGFLQVGETVQNRSVGSRTISVKGAVYGDIPERKQTMRRVMSPFSSGKLIFEDRYYTRVFVKNAPTFSPVKNDGRFSMQFFAPFPFFFDVNGKNEEIGSLIPAFSFPINYAIPHKFGEKASTRYKNIYNDGDVKTPFSVYLYASGTSKNPIVANLQTFQTLKLNGTLEVGDYVNIYRDDDNVLRAELTSDGRTTDIISWIDENSSLFELNVGDNMISATDDGGGANLTAKITFNPAVVALYET